MNLERILTLLVLVVAVLAAIPQIPVDAQIWAVVLVVLGLISGVTSEVDLEQRLVIYVLAVALPTFSNSLDAIWEVGPWVNTLLDNIAIGIQGAAVGLFVMAVKDRALPAGDDATS